MSWPASRAFSSWGSTVSSKPRTPSTRGSPAAMRAAALRRSSSWTGVDSQPEARSSPSVEGRSDGGSGGMVALMAPSLGPCAAPFGSARSDPRGACAPDRVAPVRPGGAALVWLRRALRSGKMISRQSPGRAAESDRTASATGPVRSVRGGRARRRVGARRRTTSA